MNGVNSFFPPLIESNKSVTFKNLIKYGGMDNRYTERTLFDAWSCVLEQKNHQRRGKVNSFRERSQRVLTVTERLFSDSSRFLSGLFVNYLSAVLGAANGISFVRS